MNNNDSMDILNGEDSEDSASSKNTEQDNESTSGITDFNASPRRTTRINEKTRRYVGIAMFAALSFIVALATFVLLREGSGRVFLKLAIVGLLLLCYRVYIFFAKLRLYYNEK